MIWDDPSYQHPCFFTYYHLLKNAEQISSKLTKMMLLSPSDNPIAVYGRKCPEVITAILAVMSVTRRNKVRGVAFLPVNLEAIPEEQIRSLGRCGVELVVIEISVLKVYNVCIYYYRIWVVIEVH